MTIYLLNFLTIPIYNILIKDKKKCITLIAIQMWIIMVCRSQTLGDDVLNYEQYYRVWSNYSFSEMIRSTRFILNQNVVWGLEGGYVWLCWICAKLGLKFHSFLAVHSSICMIGLSSFLKKYSKDSAFSLLIIIAFGVWGTFFYILRQSLAFVVLLFAYDCMHERKLYKFLALCMLAILFHRAAIVFIPIYFVSKTKISKKIISLFLAFSIGLIIFFSRFYRLMYLFLNLVGKEDYKMEIFQSNKMLVCFAVLFGMILLFSKKLSLLNNDETNLSLFWCFMLTIIVEIVSLYVPTFSRIAICELFPFSTVLITNIFCEQKRSNRLLMKFIGFIILFVFYIYVIKGASYVPYISIWD